MKGSHKWLKLILQNFYAHGIAKLITQYEKRLEKLGDYTKIDKYKIFF